MACELRDQRHGEVQSVHNLFELSTLEDIFRPIRNAPRVKYTCFDVSKNILILGATSGSLYVFRRHDLAFLRVIPNKEGSVVAIGIDDNESHIAFATNRGTVVVLKHNVEDSYGVHGGSRMSGHSAMASASSVSGNHPHYIQLTRNHRGSIVTTFQWNPSGSCLFIGDDHGTVTAITVSPKKTQTLFLDPSYTVVKLTSKIIQLDFFQDKLLISTLTSSYICDTTKEQYTQIGSKPRDGEFGACFSRPAANSSNKAAVIFAARPGSRLWEADIEGNVIYTHQLKNAFVRNMEPLVSVKQEFPPTNRSEGGPRFLNFTRLLSIGENHLLTWAGSHLYIVDTSSMLLILTTRLSEHILDVRLASPNEIYVQHSNNHLRWLKLLPVDMGLHCLLQDRKWEQCGRACIFFDSVVKSAQSRALLPRSALQEMEGHLRLEGHRDLANEIGNLILNIEEEPAANVMPDVLPKHYRLESGIYVVNMPKKPASQDWCQLAKRSVHLKSLKDVPLLENADGSLGIARNMDSSFGYLALPSIKANVSLGEIKSSLSSTYKSGKQRIINTMEMLEDHLKSMNTDGSIEPLDVQCDQSNIASTTSFDLDHLQEEPIIFSAKDFNRQNYAEKSLQEQFLAQNIQLDLHPLFEATNETWNVLQNLQTSDTRREKMALEQWLDVLHSTHESWYRALACPTPHNHKQRIHQSQSYDSFLKPGIDSTEHCETSKNMANDLQQSAELEMLVGECHQTITMESKNSQILQPETEKEMKSPGDYWQEDQQALSLEYVLWWQDVSSTTGPVTKQMPLQRMSTECWLCNPRFIPGNAWSISVPLKETIMQLATMCVNTKTFGRIARYCESFHNWTRIDSLDEESCRSDTESHVLRHSLAIVPKADIIMDHARSLFVKQYFGLLRPDVVFQDARSDTQWSCATWQYVLGHVIASISGISSSNLARGLHYNLQWMNPFLSILRSDSRDYTLIVNKLIEAKEKVSPRDVLYLDQTLLCGGQVFLTYMEKNFLKESKETEESSHTHSSNCEDPIVEAAWVQLMLQDKPTLESNSICAACHGPRRFSHVRPWKWQNHLIRKFRSPCLHIGLYLKLCEENGFWLGKVYLLQKLGLREEMFKLIVRLGDIGLLRDMELLKQVRQEWKSLFQLVINELEVTSLHCKDCVTTVPGASDEPNTKMAQQQTVISVEDICLLMLRHCTTDFVVSLISEFIRSHAQVRLSKKFYQTLLLATAIREQTIIANDIKMRASTFIWSKRADYASSRVKQLLLQKETPKAGTSSAKGISEKFPCHWGASVDLASCCNICSLPLGLLSANDGLRVYPCGHGYHRRCAITDTCSICSVSSN